MLQSLLKRLGVVVGCIVLLALTAIIGLVAWWSWQQYQAHQRHDPVFAEGHRVTIGAESNGNYSRLIKFSIVNSWDQRRKWLAICIALTSVGLLMLTSLLATITGSDVIRKVGQAVFLLIILAIAVYLAWNTWQYYRYHSQLKAGAREETVQVVSTSSHSTSKRSNWFYTYRATVLYSGQERVIPIAETDYETLKPGAPLQVYYNSGLNDMMSVNHKPDPTTLFATLFVWLLLLVFARQQWKKK